MLIKFCSKNHVYNTFALVRSRVEREEKLSWAEATSQLLPNCPLCSLSPLRHNRRVACCHQLLTWSQCAFQSNGRQCSRRTTRLQFEVEHNFCCSYPRLCPWAEGRKGVNWFLFIFKSYFVVNFFPLLWYIEFPRVERVSLNSPTVNT